MKKHTISAEMAMAQIAIENAMTHPEIQKKMAAYSYDRKTLLAGKAILEEVRLLHMAKQDQYGQKYESTDALQNQMSEIRKRYQQHLKIARIAFEKQRSIQEQMQLNGRRKPDTIGLIDQMYAFYSRIENVMEPLTRYNISPEELRQTWAMVEALYVALQQQMQSKGNAQHATEKRNDARKKLKTWMSHFKKTARLALQDNAQLLEVLGIQVPTKTI